MSVRKRRPAESISGFRQKYSSVAPASLINDSSQSALKIIPLLQKHLYTDSLSVDLIQGGHEHRAVQLVKEYLHDNFKSNISLDQLVALTNLKRSKLLR